MTTVTGSAPVWRFAGDFEDQLRDAYGRARMDLDDRLRRQNHTPADHPTTRTTITVEVDIP